MAWPTDALTLLRGASAAAPSGIRTFLSGGPRTAHDCHQLYVHPVTPHVVQQGGPGPLAGGACVRVPEVTYQVVYVKDCYPTPDDAGRLPDPDDVTAWTTTYLAAVEDIHGAVLDLAEGNPAPGYPGVILGGGIPCAVTVFDGVFGGPLGQACWVTIPVRVSTS